LETFENADIVFPHGGAIIKLSSGTSGHGYLSVRIPCIELDWQVSSMEQICTWCLPPISTLENLYICEWRYSQPNGEDNVENTLWLELLRPFTSVKSLYLSKKYVVRIVPALQEFVGDSATVLPALQNIFLEGQSTTIQDGIQLFFATRQVTNHPIAVSRWYKDR
jgi:hypothetical protein